MLRHHAPVNAGTEQMVTNMRGDRAFDIHAGKIVCHETPFLQRVLVLTLAAAALGTLGTPAGAASAAKPATAHAAVRPATGFHLVHRSIWAAKWATQHPVEEAAYQRSIMGKYARRPAHGWRRWSPRGRAAHTWIGAYGAPHTTYWGTRRWRRSRHANRWVAALSPAPIHVPVSFVAPVKLEPVPTATPNTAPLPSTAIAHGSNGGGQNGIRVAYAAPTSTHIEILPSIQVATTTQPASVTVAAKKPAPVQRVAKADPQVADNNGGYDDASPNVSLDFVAADINDIIKSLAMQTHTNIVSGADVKGDITASLNNVSLDEALDMITKLSGFSYAKVGKTYVVGTPTSIQALTTSGTASMAPVTAVITLEYSDAAQMETSIKDRYPNVKVTMGNTVGNVSAGGVLIITGTDEDVAGVKSLVDASETALANGMATAKTVLYHVNYTSPMDLISVLGRLVPSLVVTPAPTQGFNLSAPMTADAGGTSTTSGAGSTGSSASGGSSTSSSSNGSSTTTSSSVAVKPSVNALLLTGTDNDISRALDILKEVDIKAAQISYDAKITELSLGDVHNLGVNWDFSGATTRIGELPDQTSGTPTLGAAAGNIIKFGLISRTPVNDLATVSIDALFTNSNTKVLADPNISAVDGQQAAVFIGDTVEYVSSIAQTTTGPTVTTASVNVGIKLYVAGKVSNDGYVTVNIHPEVSTISSWLNVPGGGQLPQISSREATTTVRVKDGDYIAIGGLINEQDIKSIQKVPGLGDLPFLGSLFRNTQDTKNRDEIVIFVKVSIDKDAT